MSTITSLMKAGVLVCTTALFATAAAAHHNGGSSSSSGYTYSGNDADDDNTVTVYVYEKGYLPNIAYLDGKSYVKFVNKTQFRLGLDFDNYNVVVDSLSSGSSAIVAASYLSGRELYAPYFEDYDRYIGSGKFETNAGAAPLGY